MYMWVILTGTLDTRRNSSKASRDPRVEAWTYTPFSSSLMEFRVCFSSRTSSSCRGITTQRTSIHRVCVCVCVLVTNSEMGKKDKERKQGAIHNY